MTVNSRIPDIINQAFEAGRAVERYAMAEMAKINEALHADELTNADIYAKAGPSHPAVRKLRAGEAKKATAKAANVPQAPKATVVARGVKKAAGPRAKGVKEEIVRLIRESAEGLRVADIVAQTGFKETSVRATLMGLKKSGIAALGDEKHWVLTAQSWAGVSGNSDHDEAHVDV